MLRAVTRRAARGLRPTQTIIARTGIALAADGSYQLSAGRHRTCWVRQGFTRRVLVWVLSQNFNLEVPAFICQTWIDFCPSSPELQHLAASRWNRCHEQILRRAVHQVCQSGQL